MPSLKTSRTIANYALLAQHANLVSRGVRLVLVNAPIGISFCESDGTQFTTVAPQTWLTGTRVRLVANGGGPPSIVPLTTATTYWLIRLSNSTFRLASSYANAIAFTSITIPIIAAGSYQLQAIPIGEWLQASITGVEIARWETSHPAYTARFALTAIVSLPAITAAAGLAYLKIVDAVITNSAGISLFYNALVLWESASTTPGNSAAGAPICLSAIESVVSGVVIPGMVEILPTASRSVSYSLSGFYND